MVLKLDVLNNNQMSQIDKASKEYWTSFWNQLPLPAPIDLTNKGLSSYSIRKIDAVYEKYLSHLKGKQAKILELGCGNSVFLSYFHKQYGLEIYGLDYSELGCKQTEKILERDGLKGEIIQGDIFNPPQELIGAFDVVCSFGVLEHFEDSVNTINAFKKFLKPGGILITTVPYLKGATGILQKIMNKPVYDIHVLMNKTDVNNFLNQAELHINYCEYHLPISFGVTLEQHEGKPISFLGIKKLILKSLQVISKMLWWIDDKIVKLPVLPFFTAGIISVATLNEKK
jgi:2-polyprenyl-3-methyl-5-hydroxy-6-metoxy-1,4-benzoquinol methylase